MIGCSQCEKANTPFKVSSRSQWLVQEPLQFSRFYTTWFSQFSLSNPDSEWILESGKFTLWIFDTFSPFGL